MAEGIYDTWENKEIRYDAIDFIEVILLSLKSDSINQNWVNYRKMNYFQIQ